MNATAHLCSSPGAQPARGWFGHRLHFFLLPPPPPSVPSDPKQIYDNVIVGTIVSIMAIHPARCSGTTRLAFGSRRSVLSLANNIIFYLINCHLNCTLKLSNSSKLTVEIDRVITSFEFSFDFFYQLLFSSFFENFLFQQGKTIS